MSSLTIKTPSNGDPISWFNFINTSKSQLNSSIETLIVDFNDLYYLDTDDLVLLGCLMDLFYNQNIKIEFINGASKLKKHLNGIKFKKYWTIGFNRDNFTKTHNKNTLCLWHISPSMVASYSEYAKKYFENAFFKGKDLLPIATNMSEIFNNIFDHSKSPVNGYIITQYSPISQKLSFSVCDFGIGIANSLNNYYEKKGIDRVTDSQAIKNSLETGVSSFSTNRNRGFGLSNVQDFTENFKGRLTIYSNNGLLYKEFNNSYYLKETNLNFSGTLIKVEISTLEFDEIDDENEIFDI